MKLVVVQRGRLRDRQIAALRDDYVTRFRRFGTLRVLETERAGEELWPASSRWRVLVDETGACASSEDLARQLAQWSMRHGEVAFAIGDAYGHHPETVSSAQARLSLGPMTLPHQLAHLVLVEQLYRAGTILAGTPYHDGRS